MAERPSTQFYLADLVMVVLLCGLGAALVISVRTPGDAALRFLLLVIVMVSWSVFRAHRRAPTCEECGRRFVRPKQKAIPGSCPHCGREPIARARLLRLVSTIFWGLTAVLVLFGLMPATVPWFGLGPHDAIAMTGSLIAFCGLNLAVLAITGISIYRSVLTWPRERTCEGCGGTIPVEPPAGPSICPACRVRHLRPGEAKKEQAKNAGVLLLFLGAVTFIAMSLLRLGSGSGSGMSGWIRFPLVFLAMSAGAFGALVVCLILLQMLRRRQIRSERGALSMARTCAGREGEVVKQGNSLIWYSGADDPTPMLREQTDAARRRFATLTGGAAVAQPSVRTLVFHDRGAFLRFHRRIFPGVDFSSFDGQYLGHPYRLSTLCVAPPIGRITEPEKTVRSLAGYALLESVCGPKPIPWVRSGLNRATANGDDGGGLARLNRKMVASLADGTAMSSEIFTFSHRELWRLIRSSRDPGGAQRFWQLTYQAWSIVEYLAGERAPRDLRTSLDAFLHDPRSKTDQEDSFQDHFGSSFGPFLDGWRQWVLEQGIGTHDPPPHVIGEGLLNRVLPVIRDRQAKRGDRIVAIREWTHLGFVVGADVLIDLLRDPGDIPREEVIWALAMVSGMAWGDDPERWQTWWDELVSTSAEALTAPLSSSRRIETEPSKMGSDGASIAAPAR